MIRTPFPLLSPFDPYPPSRGCRRLPSPCPYTKGKRYPCRVASGRTWGAAPGSRRRGRGRSGPRARQSSKSAVHIASSLSRLQVRALNEHEVEDTEVPEHLQRYVGSHPLQQRHRQESAWDLFWHVEGLDVHVLRASLL